MIIDVHGHYTTAPPELRAWRQRQNESQRENGYNCESFEHDHHSFI